MPKTCFNLSDSTDSKEEPIAIAREAYCTMPILNVSAVARMAKVTRDSVNRWAKEEKWDALRQARETNSLQEIYNIVGSPTEGEQEILENCRLIRRLLKRAIESDLVKNQDPFLVRKSLQLFATINQKVAETQREAYKRLR